MNYADLLTAIQDGCENTESSFVTHIPDFVHAAEQVIYQAVQLPISRKHVTGLATENSRYLTAPTDFIAAFSAAVITPGTGEYHQMQFRDVDWIRSAYPEPSVTGMPDYYGVWNSTTFLLSKTPAAGYTIELHYYGMPTSIVSASTSWIGDNFDSVLYAGAMFYAQTYLKGEADVLKLFADTFKEGLLVLKAAGDNTSKERKI